MHGSIFSTPFTPHETEAFLFRAAQVHSFLPNLSFLSRESFPDLGCSEISDRPLILGDCKGFE
jgi:hypothetical protein